MFEMFILSKIDEPIFPFPLMWSWSIQPKREKHPFSCGYLIYFKSHFQGPLTDGHLSQDELMPFLTLPRMPSL